MVATEHGKGTFVRHQRLVRHEILRIMRAEYQHAEAGTMPDRGLFELTTAVPVGAVHVPITYTTVPASADLAEAFQVEDGAELLERRYLFVVDGKPHQVSKSYLLGSMVAGTALTDPANERPGRGTMAQLREIGVKIDRLEMDIHARMPSPDEAATFDISEGVPILIDRRRSYAQDRVVVVSDSVTPADRGKFGFDITLAQL